MLCTEAAEPNNYRGAGWAAVPSRQRIMPGLSEARRFDIRQTPAVWFVALTLPMQQKPSLSLRYEEQLPARGQPFPGNARPGESSGETLEVSRLTVWPFVRSKASEPREPVPPPPPLLPGASVSRGETARTQSPSSVAPPALPAAGPDPAASAPRLYLVDVAVGATADALNQLEVLLRVPAGQIEAGVHGGPRVPPASLPGRGGGALRGPHGEWEPLPAPCSPGGHNRPAPRCGRRRSPHAAAAADDNDLANRPRPPRCPQPCRKPGSHPQGEENARSPLLGVKLQHGFRLRRSSPSPYSGSSALLRSPPPFPGSSPTAQPQSRRKRSRASRASDPCALRLGAPARLQLAARRYPNRTAAASPGAESRPTAAVGGQKRFAFLGPREGQAESYSYSLLIPRL
ncbi:PREDICTED: uncharacterized protein LOC109385458 [Hipposideros armiger]|uniref:Uncharacterized protein LOC109385458 n=1 Tax=Hipposideros armiger TaxID=186990 RepID=A0A8B7RSM6_HIPAR|nr:PREDICTED: uncharacterized protein LOC109385458 [Hipposideros armiger]